MTTDPPDVLTVDEAADWLRVSRWTLYNLIRSNQLRTIKIGRRRLVPRSALAAYLDQLTHDQTLKGPLDDQVRNRQPGRAGRAQAA